MAEFIDLTGFIFHKLKVIQLYCGGHGLKLQWECICECGKKTIVDGHKLQNGHTKSCGCLKGKHYENLVGRKFNLLTVVSFHSNKNKKVRWNCVCDCGGTNIVQSGNLKNGAVKSCGCLMNGIYSIKHGLKHTRLYAIWDNMKGRCYRPSMSSFKDYGALGIKICDEWINDCNKFFEWAMANGYMEDLTIERDDNLKGYEPDNCKWIPKSEQSRNRKTALGVQKVIEIKKLLNDGFNSKELSIKYNVHVATIRYIKNGKNYSYVIV